MLSRVANNFYWMGRYMERASCMSRLLLAQINEMSEDSSDFISAGWKGLFDSLRLPNLKEGFLLKAKNESPASDDFLLADAYTLADYLTFETYHGGSILNCLEFVRENAHQNQEKLAGPVWPHINRYYLRFKKMSLKDLWPDKIVDFYKDVLEFTGLFYGLTQDALYQDESARFIQMGRYLERFQNTASIFENHISSMMAHKEDEEDLIGLLLRCGALDSYRLARSLDLKLRKVTNFLIHDSAFPRSLQFSSQKIKESLIFIEEKRDFNAPIYQSVETLGKKLNEKSLGRPLAQFLSGLYQESAQIHQAIDKIYFNRKGLEAYAPHDQ